MVLRCEAPRDVDVSISGLHEHPNYTSSALSNFRQNGILFATLPTLPMTVRTPWCDWNYITISLAQANPQRTHLEPLPFMHLSQRFRILVPPLTPPGILAHHARCLRRLGRWTDHRAHWSRCTRTRLSILWDLAESALDWTKL